MFILPFQLDFCRTQLVILFVCNLDHPNHWTIVLQFVFEDLLLAYYNNKLPMKSSFGSSFASFSYSVRTILVCDNNKLPMKSSFGSSFACLFLGP